jgi:predicted Zn-dependent peptidase
MWNDPTASEVRVSVRIHSGAAFDPQGKEGVMQLLAENIFPTAASRAYFAEDLGGSFGMVTNYDYIQINASAKPSEFVTLFETIAQAVSSPTIDKETTTAIKKALAEKLAALEADPTYIADRAVAKRLFGTFPYGRPQMGSIDSLERIDFADLVFAKERFLSADNATVAISGNFNPDLGYRAARRYFGAWLKSDKRVPSTFRQPDDPDTKPLEINFNGTSDRTAFALRGIARNDPDYVAAAVLEKILIARAQKVNGGAAVELESRTLPGVVMLRVPSATSFPFPVLSDRISEGEFASARTQVATEFASRSLSDQWLDVDTYRTTVAGDTQAFQKLTIADVQRVADRLSKNPIATVILRATATSN